MKEKTKCPYTGHEVTIETRYETLRNGNGMDEKKTKKSCTEEGKHYSFCGECSLILAVKRKN
jgi:hypothetical protein